MRGCKMARAESKTNLYGRTCDILTFFASFRNRFLLWYAGNVHLCEIYGYISFPRLTFKNLERVKYNAHNA